MLVLLVVVIAVVEHQVVVAVVADVVELRWKTNFRTCRCRGCYKIC